MTKLSSWALGALAAVAAATALTAAPPAARADVQISFPLQAMDGNLQLSPGTTVEAGYDFTMPGNHPAAKVVIENGLVSLQASCVSGSGGGVIKVHLAWSAYVDPLNDGGDWFPTAEQTGLQSYEGAATVPNLCGGGLVSVRQGGTFTATLASSDPTDRVAVRWHYGVIKAGGSLGGNWSGTQSFVPGPGGPPAPPQPQPTQVIVKVNLAGGYTIGDVTAAYPVTVDPGGLATFGIYLVSPTLPQSQWPPGELQNLANQINGDHNVVDYAQVNLPVKVADTEFYAWPFGAPSPAGKLPAAYTRQAAAGALQLAAAHQQSTGNGIKIAVLDTGATPVPALHNRLLKGWNYVADNSDTRDVASPAGDAAVGHGTFVSGLIALVAPQAKIIPEKVLNGAGFGTIYGAAQAILNATAAGASVINLSFGTQTQPQSNLLQQAIQQAQAAGVVVVAAAGNNASNQQEYPASWPQTVSVAAMDETNSSLAVFSNYGGWVDVGAPGEGVVGPMPNGGYDVWAGTSMSAPFVAGQAALIRSLVPGMQASQVFQAIEQTATKLQPNPLHNGAINIVSSLQFAGAHP